MRRPEGRLQATVLAGCVLAYGGLFEAYLQAPAAPPSHREFWVAPAGRADNDGSRERPLDLATALSAAGPVHAGDTVWLVGGSYPGPLTSTLTGTASAPIVVRQVPGQRVIIDGASSGRDTLSVLGAHTWFWGLEITSTDPKRRTAETGSWPSDLRRGYGSVTRAPGIRYINMIVHDNANGLGLWSEAVGADAYGNIIYNNGWQGPDRAHGHGIYTQNQFGERRISDNIIFNQFSHGIHAYGSSSAPLDNITLEGNIVFNNGALAASPEYERNILLGGGRPATNPRLENNMTYFGAGKSSGENNVGYDSGCMDLRAQNNYLVGSRPLVLRNCEPRVFTNNTLYSSEEGGLPFEYPGNHYYAEPPTGTHVFVRPNRCEPGRAHVAIYNWDSRAEVTVDLVDASLVKGERYVIQDVQNLFGRPVVEGTFDGSPAVVRMVGLESGPAVGDIPGIAHTAPRFGVFLVLQPAVIAAAASSASTCVTGNTGTFTFTNFFKGWGF